MTLSRAYMLVECYTAGSVESVSRSGAARSVGTLTSLNRPGRFLPRRTGLVFTLRDLVLNIDHHLVLTGNATANIASSA